jgi:Fe-S oxidoreductase
MMCPTFVATGDEVMSTRGRANIIRAALEMRVRGHDPLRSAELDAALSNCLSCKGCTPECPSNVNLALLKAEMTYARHRRDGLPVRERILSNVDLLGRMGCMMPALANATLEFRPLRALMEKTLGISAKRSLPPYARQRFDEWFAKHLVGSVRWADRTPRRSVPARGPVILWDDTFVRYNEPHIGIAAVKVLETLGFDVELARNRRCCGRPAFSQGNLDAATKLGRHNIDLLGQSGSSTPIVFLEPSCYSMFAEDYRDLKIDRAEKVATRCFLFENFVDDLLAREPTALPFNGQAKNQPVHVAIHAHCHAKSLMNTGFMARLVERLPGKKATLLDTGCCGMAGAFGALASKYDLSLQVAEPLVRKIAEQPAGSEIVASGTSCRHQICDLTRARPKHMAEIIAAAI